MTFYFFIFFFIFKFKIKLVNLKKLHFTLNPESDCKMELETEPKPEMEPEIEELLKLADYDKINNFSQIIDGNDFTSKKYFSKTIHDLLRKTSTFSKYEYPHYFIIYRHICIFTYTIQYTGLNWSYFYLSSDPKITWDIIKSNPHKPWNYMILSLRSDITWDIVKAHPELPWNYSALSLNKNITFDIVKKDIEETISKRKDEWVSYLSSFIISDIKWDFNSLSINENITWEIIQENPIYPWSYTYLSLNPNITWDIVKANPDKPWDYSKLSANVNITWDIVQANPDKPWDYSQLSANDNITWDIVKAHPGVAWNYRNLSLNKNITFEIVKKDIEETIMKRESWSSYLSSFVISDIKWDLNALFMNENIKHNTDEKKELEILFKVSPQPSKTMDISCNPKMSIFIKTNLKYDDIVEIQISI